MTGIHDAAAAYALDALDPDELAEFEAHLAGCAQCRREVADLEEAASGLVLAGDAPPPPPALRADVLAAIAGVEQLAPLPTEPRRALAPVGAEPAPAPTAVPPTAGSGTAEVPTVTAVDAGHDELALRRASRRTRVLSLLVAAATVVALALGGVVWSLARQQQTPPVAAAPAVDPSLLSAPDAEVLPATLPNGARVSFVVSKSQNRAVFVSGDLPSPGPGNVYHLWSLKGRTVVRPDNTLAGGTGVVQAFSGPVGDSDRLAVNIEPAGTAPQAPTTPVLKAVEI